MFSSEFFELLKQILKSWQVIVVTIVLVLYIYIVNNVSKSYRHPKARAEKVKKPKKAEPAPPPPKEDDEEEPDHSSNDELGLEEA